ncbi:hypothetical protein NDU88_002114 [Pleurodeles waltl]|uniref:Uncharacterized protein n=1 Tax=Pleurodeles waltl TaxID=8319 RepID=A0AAV7MWH0_PLEWA|nr:hypothetical protein NDU88_002114 [Pleurodeles waltl]
MGLSAAGTHTSRISGDLSLNGGVGGLEDAPCTAWVAGTGVMRLAYMFEFCNCEVAAFQQPAGFGTQRSAPSALPGVTGVASVQST